MVAYHGTAAIFERFDSSFRGENTGGQGAEMATFLAVHRREATYYAELSAQRLARMDEPHTEQVLVCEISDDLRLLSIDGEGDLAELIEDDQRALRYALSHNYDGVRWPGGNASNAGDTIAIFDADMIAIRR